MTDAPSAPAEEASAPVDPAHLAGDLSGGTGANLTDFGTTLEPPTPPTQEPAKEKLQVDSQNQLFNTDGSWSDKPSVANQEAQYPDTVRHADVQIDVFDFSCVKQREAYTALFSQILSGERVIQQEVRQNPDPGLVNFRLMLVHCKREYMNIRPR